MDGKLLCIEPVEEDYTLIETVVSSILGHSVIRAINVKEALPKLKRNRNSISLILLDDLPPFVDGLEAVKELQAADRGIPIVAISSKTVSPEYTRRWLEAGCKEYASKPLTGGFLIRLVDQYM